VLWVLGAAVAVGAIAMVARFVDFMGDSQGLRDAFRHMIGNSIALSLSLLNWLCRYIYRNEAVLPWGLTISLSVLVILFCSGLSGWQTVIDPAWESQVDHTGKAICGKNKTLSGVWPPSGGQDDLWVENRNEGVNYRDGLRRRERQPHLAGKLLIGAGS